MIPWHTGGVYSAATLGVATLSYLPYYFLGIVTPILCVVMAFFNVGTFGRRPKEKKQLRRGYIESRGKAKYYKFYSDRKSVV